MIQPKNNLLNNKVFRKPKCIEEFDKKKNPKGLKLTNADHKFRGKETKFWQRVNQNEVIKWKRREAESASSPKITPQNYGSGSVTNNDVGGTRLLAKEFFGKKFIAGHLLAYCLGGKGQEKNYENITAFTSSANSLHLHRIETFAKDKIHKEGKEISYKITIANWETFKRRDIDKKTLENYKIREEKTIESAKSLPEIPKDSLVRVENIATGLTGEVKVLSPNEGFLSLSILLNPNAEGLREKE